MHATTSQRRRRNKIEGLDDDGVWYENQDDIKRIVLSYFSSIYSSDHPNSFDASLSAVCLQVTPEMNDELISIFEKEEIRVALNQMHPTKAPSPDGMSPIFFQTYWDVVGQSVINCVIQILNTGVTPNGLNDTYICLIPKISCP